MDLDSIEAGLDFAEVIQGAVDSCVVLLALIGRQWLTLADGDGRRRLDNPDDYVRFEIQTALERGARVIPVLVDGAKPPRQQQLPAELQKLARLNAFELSYGRYQYDADRLLDLIDQVLAATPSSGTRPASAPAGNSGTHSSQVPVSPNHLPGGAQSLANESATGSTLDSGVASMPETTAPKQPIRLLADAERTAQSLSLEQQKARALAKVASVLAAIDPDRAARLFDETERIAQSITDGPSKSGVLADIAAALIGSKVNTYVDRAARLFDDAERTAKACEGGIPLSLVVDAMAAVDPDRAERAAQGLYELLKSIALAEVAKVLAATDPDRANRIAQSITYEPAKMDALTSIATALAAVDRRRAVRLLADAERIAQSTPMTKDVEARALSDRARALASIDRGRAVRLLADAEHLTKSVWPEDLKSRTLAHVMTALAAIDPDRAERTARLSITSELYKTIALADIARVLAATDPGGAERIARSIDNPFLKAIALADVAKVLTDADRAPRNAPSSPPTIGAGKPPDSRLWRRLWRL